MHSQFATGNARTRVVEAVQKHLIEEKLLAFMDGESYADSRQFIRPGRSRDIGDVNGRVGEAIIEIFPEYPVAVICQARLVKALSLCGLNFGKLLLWKRVTAFHSHPCYPSLRTLLDRDLNRQQRRIILKFGNEFAIDFSLPEPACAIQALNA